MDNLEVFPQKLVRDRIPEIIKNSGKPCQIEYLNPEDYRQALRDKLIEEAQEAAQAQDDHLLSELADLQEVIDALLSSYEISPESLKQRQQQRQQERGGFAQQIRLLRVGGEGDR
ncbi:nucleoside triphosphate pyrophosphohydrolase [Phormidium yuhuli AB48]|uniref:Nucleoside triphosphate pyrophosphohydrolase n=1 Tax=Phormidium yuhuli AB48 TaxID=2940671 RepID=A0ABY5AL74_9CYAN|nr:nucleoside triphosphate pyrophosphohydrolase [Phormidium yuhuli]USR89954.1 nucleoside triphosphate pyrophosphohydrolase [Phormidium yuhuli AB48]